MLSGIKDDSNAELLQQICDLLVTAGYFRARLQIDAFDKILGGICWCITGSNNEIDLEFEDDLILGQKIKLSEKVSQAMEIMGSPTKLFPHQIQGLDYAAILPVLKWLITELKKSRDTRGAINRKQGLLNYSLFNQVDRKAAPSSVDPDKLNAIIFNNKPKRVYKANRSAAIAFNDAKRVHTALREFNDLSANAVFQNIVEQIEQMDQENTFKAGFGKVATGQKGHRGTISSAADMKSGGNDFFNEKGGRSGTISGGNSFEPQGASALENLLDLESTTQDDIIANVEIMIQQEQRKNDTLKKDKKKAAGNELDLNIGMVGTVRSHPQQQKTGVQTQQSGTPNANQPAGNKVGNATQATPANIGMLPIPQKGTNTPQTTASTTANDTTRASMSSFASEQSTKVEEEEFGAGALDGELTFIRRQTIAVKAGNVQAAFVQNLTSIQESVNNFQKLKEDAGNDIVLQFQSQKEQYENQIEKLAARVQKQAAQREELAKLVTTLQSEVEQLEYERQQYQEQITLVSTESEQVETQINKSSVKANEVTVVSALIEEKVRLAEAKTTLKKQCREEKTRLDQELERIKQRRQKIEEDAQSAALQEIDTEFDQKNEKLIAQKKLLADQNRKITIIQRKIETCPSNVELSQFNKRLVELFDSMNFKSDENRKYFNLFNTVQDTKVLFNQELSYLGEINRTYKAAQNKKAKEVLLFNLQNIQKITSVNVTKSSDDLENLKTQYRQLQTQYEICINEEKEHFKRIKDFETACDLNEKLRS